MMDRPADNAVAAASAAQHQATAPGATVWVNASAGTGKTKVLTDRVLRLLLAGTAPDKLLCITFTKAAAANMADRVRSILADWATGPQDRLVERLIALIGRAPSQEEVGRARHLFAAVLDAPGGLKILTIHAFCQSLLRRFPVEAGVSPHFELLDERATAELLHTIRNRLLADPPPGCAAAVDYLAMAANEDQIAGLVDDLLGNRATLLREMGGQGDAARLIDKLRRALDLPPGETAQDVLAGAVAEGAFDRAGLIAAAERLKAGSASAGALGARVQDWLAAEEDDRAAGWDDYQSIFLTGKGEIRDRSFLGDKQVKDDPAALDALTKEGERIQAVAQRLRRHATLADNSALYRLAAALLEAYEAAKRARGVLDYDDLIIRADALLSTPGRAAWVLYKLDRGIDHVLIDEAQDTNPEQWEVVNSLVEDFFAGAGARAEAVRTLFVVGDEKQSIFTFQGADPVAFAKTRASLAARVEAAGQSFAEVPLTISFRSVQAVLDAVDATFIEDAPQVGLGDRYAPHRAARAGAGGRVELWPLVPEEESAPIEAWAPPLERDRATPPAVRLADAVAERVAAMIGREEIAALGRPVVPGDVLILVRTRRNPFFAEVVRALKRRGVPVAGVDRMSLSEQMAVKDLLVLGEVLLLPQDDLALAILLRSPFVDWPEERLFDLAHGRDGTLWTALRALADTDAEAAGLVDWLRDLLAKADRVGPFSLFAGVLAQPCPADPTGSGRRALVQRLGHDAEDPIDEFLDLADRFEQTHPAGLQRFLHWLTAAETELKRELEAGAGDAVRLMTVHGAKGLQGRIVILADTQLGNPQRPPILWPRDGSPLPLWVRGAKGQRDAVSEDAVGAYETRRWHEDKRLLYVAMTRAEDQLIVTGIEGRRARGGEDIPSLRWHEMVARGLQRLDDLTVTPFTAWEGEHLVYAQPQTATLERAPSAPAEQAVDVPLPDHLRRPPPAEPSPPRPLAPSRPSLPDPAPRSPMDSDGEARFRRGLLLHTLLQFLPDLPIDERAAAARRYLAHPGHELTDEEQAAYAAEVIAVLDDPRFASLFGPASRAEVPIAATIGTNVIAGQVDRLVVEGGTVTVLDWKTNRPPPARAEDVAPSYLRQMAGYRAALRQMMGDRTVVCLLGWTDGPALMRLPDSLLDAHAPGGVSPLP